MRDLERKEVAIYCRLTGVRATFFPNYSTAQPPRTSIAQVSSGTRAPTDPRGCRTPLGEQPSAIDHPCRVLDVAANVAPGLVAQLQAEFPSTVHNILRTLLKLKVPPAVASTETAPQLCPLCTSYVTVAVAAASPITDGPLGGTPQPHDGCLCLRVAAASCPLPRCQPGGLCGWKMSCVGRASESCRRWALGRRLRRAVQLVRVLPRLGARWTRATPAQAHGTTPRLMPQRRCWRTCLSFPPAPQAQCASV